MKSLPTFLQLKNKYAEGTQMLILNQMKVIPDKLLFEIYAVV